MSDEPAEVLTAGEMVQALVTQGFDLVAGHHGLDRPIRQPTVQRVGVALTGYTEHLEPDRVQLIGRSESGYLRTRPAHVRHAVLSRLIEVGFPVMVVSAGNAPSQELIDLSNEHGFVLLVTQHQSVAAIERINLFLRRAFAPAESRHGVLIDVYGVGLLLIGKSSIGKSEVALELISAGHRLVADDVVRLSRESRDSVVGSCPELTRHHIEIRGLGILNILHLFGATAVRERKRVELIVELVEWDPNANYDRLGLDQRYIELAGVPVDFITLPVRPGRSLRVILEIAVRDRLLKYQGTHSAQAFAERLDEHLRQRLPAHRPKPNPQDAQSE